jgi:hypothetical protein
MMVAAGAMTMPAMNGTSFGGRSGASVGFQAEDDGGQQSWIGGAWNWILGSASSLVSPLLSGGVASPPSHQPTDEEITAALDELDAQDITASADSMPDDDDQGGGAGQYLWNSLKQVGFGNYTPDEERTLLGTIGEIGVGFIPYVGSAASARDLSYDLTHWEWTWWHGIQTAGDLIGLIPFARGFTKTAGATARAIKGSNTGAKALSRASKVARLADQLHHSLPKFLGGKILQIITKKIPYLAHKEFHQLLREELRLAGIPLPVGGPKGSARAWAQYFRLNPGAQKTAIDAVLKASRAIDAKYGTEITQDVWRNLVAKNYRAIPRGRGIFIF